MSNKSTVTQVSIHVSLSKTQKLKNKNKRDLNNKIVQNQMCNIQSMSVMNKNSDLDSIVQNQYMGGSIKLIRQQKKIT